MLSTGADTDTDDSRLGWLEIRESASDTESGKGRVVCVCAGMFVPSC